MDASGLRERRRRDTETEIERSALALFAGRGFEKVTMDEVAAAAGVSTRTLFRYFPAKIDLALGRIRRIDDALRSAIDGATSLSALEERIDAELTRVLADPATAEHLTRVHHLIRDDAPLRAAADLAPRAAAPAPSAPGSDANTDGPTPLKQRVIAELATATLRAAFLSWVESGPGATPATLLSGYRGARGLRRSILDEE